MHNIKLTQYSHGAGCGCKIAPDVLDQILKSNIAIPNNDKLIVGNNSKDDAAVYDIGHGQALISTTDFFMPIVDDPYNFGKIASANAISDVYAMGGKPILAIAILGWPINTISTEVASMVINGSRSICSEAGISLAGGHSIDAPEPIFGLAVNGIVNLNNLKQNNKAKPGDYLFLTKPIGVGILTTAEKKGLLKDVHKDIAPNQMMRLNKIGEDLGKISGVNAMTDVTGFGLLGHLLEICIGSNLSAEVIYNNVPQIIDELQEYLSLKSIPGGTMRNLNAYGHNVSLEENLSMDALHILADPQTSGGLLISVEEKSCDEVVQLMLSHGLINHLTPIGRITPLSEKYISVK
jgi:selenide,water dikinase